MKKKTEMVFVKTYIKVFIRYWPMVRFGTPTLSYRNVE